MEPFLDARLTRRRAIRLLTASALAPLIPGCARAPSGAGINTGPVLAVTMTVLGTIQQQAVTGTNPYNYYFVVLNLTDYSSDPGPVPVVTEPSALNGFATASGPQDSYGDNPAQGFVAFVLYCPSVTQTSSGYQLYNVPADTADSTRKDGLADINTLGLSNFLPQGEPDYAPLLSPGASQLVFRVNLNRLPNYNRTQGPPRYLQINFINTNNLPQSTDMSVPKYWDALGNGPNPGVNPFLVLDITQNQLLTNSQESSNPAVYENPSGGDVWNWEYGVVSDSSAAVSSLDIIDWSVQITA
jgi:hypothetical protein